MVRESWLQFFIQVSAEHVIPKDRLFGSLYRVSDGLKLLCCWYKESEVASKACKKLFTCSHMLVDLGPVSITSIAFECS